MAEKQVKIGLVGFGTVGCGVAKIITEEADSIAAKTGNNREKADKILGIGERTLYRKIKEYNL